MIYKKTFFRSVYLATAVIACCFPVLGQAPDGILATAKGMTFTVADLSAEKKNIYEKRAEIVAANRKKFLEQTVAEMLLAAEAKERGTTAERFLASELAKLTRPTEAEIKAVYDANQNALGGRSLEQTRRQIVAFLMQEPERKAEAELITALKAKHKFAAGKDVNAADLKPFDNLFSIAGKQFSAREFEEMNYIALNDVEVHIYEELLAALEDTILEKLVAAEAASRNIDSGALIAAEITDKMRDYTDSERANLWAGLQKQLFTKYAVKIMLPEPKPLVLNVSADDDPSIGPATAPVTVVMFIDYQCSACAAFSPIAKQVAAEFGQRVRIVVRDFPLESVHENAFAAALAANAAHRQGKFFEYGALLYTNQTALDEDSLLGYAARLGMDAAKFKADMADPKNAEEVRKDAAEGRSYGVSGTPTIFINGVKHHGLSEAKFRAALEKALNAVK